MSDFPILEYDETPEAVIEPRRLIARIDVPEWCVFCFFQDVIRGLVESGRAREVARQRSEMGHHPLYELDYQGQRVGVFHPGVGAPLAGGFLEEIIALGCSRFVACGGAGVLDSAIACGHLIVPSAAVRDEGTSYHYLPPSREVEASPSGVAAIERVLKRRGVEYLVGKTWTTDGLYRETPDKVRRRREEGCLSVEMEASAFFAVARFRGVQFAQILYGGDDVGAEKWDSRDWIGQTTVREKLFWLAVEACAEM